MSSVADISASPEDRDQWNDRTSALTLAPPPVEVRRNSRLLSVLGLSATVVAVAYLSRAIASGAMADWLTAIGLGTIAGCYLLGWSDGRTPLLVADAHGVRVRRGRTWVGLGWSSIGRIGVAPRRGLRDGRLRVELRDPEAVQSGLGASTRRRLWLATRLYGAPFAVPLSLTTRSSVTSHDELVENLQLLARDGAVIEDLTPLPAEEAADSPDPVEVPEVAPVSPLPSRPLIAAARTEIRLDREGGTAEARVSAILAQADSGEPGAAAPLLETTPEAPVASPVIGPELAAARSRLGLTVDQLAERTRIRPHVIEGIEVDDFGPCGGDFYARGHLRTLARVLGAESPPLIAAYDEHYAHAPISPQAVFEADLSRGGPGLGSTKGGPRWSILVAAVMTLILAWSVARLILDTPVEPTQPVSSLNGSGGVGNGRSAAPPVPVLVTAASGGARIVVRDGQGTVVFNGDLAFGETRALEIAPPVRIQSTDGGVRVSVDGVDRGAMGSTGRAGSRTYVANQG